MGTPGMVDEFRIGAAAEDLGVAISEFAVHLAEGCDLGRADEGEVLGPEEIQLPLAFVILVSDVFESALDLAADGCGERIRGEFFSYSDHCFSLRMNCDLVRNFFLRAAPGAEPDHVHGKALHRKTLR